MIKCDLCDNPATVHMTEIKNGKKMEKHLCEQCAAKHEMLPSKSHTPINELLTNFVLAHSGLQSQTTQSCQSCGITWADFRQNGLLGCPADYDLFEKELTPLLQRAHEGGTHHSGKVPARVGTDGSATRRMVDLGKLRKELARAVEAEDYEKAAKLRDSIKEAEKIG